MGIIEWILERIRARDFDNIVVLRSAYIFKHI
jgi:hypothetical protein